MKAFTIQSSAHVFFYSEPVHMANSFDGLMELVAKKMKKKPESGDLFFFSNPASNYIKILFWSKDGHCIFAKRLPHGKFDVEDQPQKMTVAALEAIVNEVIIHGGKTKRHLQIAAHSTHEKHQQAA